jgi:hypothetical protein
LLSHYKVFAALHVEAREGWIWLPPNPNLTPGTVEVRNPRNGRSIVCEMRLADTNFKRVYNAQDGTRHLPDVGDFVVISDWYRRCLGILDTKSEIPLELEETTNRWSRYVRLFVEHPSPVVRTSIVLGLVSFGLGGLGLLLGLLSVWLSVRR